MKEEKQKKKSKNKKEDLHIGFFRKMRISIIDFEQYHVIAAEGWKKALIYLVQMVLMLSIIITCSLSYKLSMTITSMCLYAKNSIPDFKVENNQFSIASEQPIVIENNEQVKTKIVLDNENDSSKYIETFDVSQENIIIITKDYIHLKTNIGGEAVYPIKDLCERFGISSITKDELISALENNTMMYVLFVYLFIALFIIYYVSILIDILALSVVGFLVSRIVGLPLKYSAVFGMATSSMTLPIILNITYLIVNMCTGFTMKYFQIMYTLVSYIYLIASIVLMRSNLMKINTKKSKIIRKDDAESAGEE